MDKKDFIVNVGPNGTFQPSGSYQSTPSDIDGLFQEFEAEKTKRITINFHGGLVSEKKGLEYAIKMGERLTNIGQQPICFVWETGLIETVSSNIGKISETKLFGKLIKILAKKLASKLGFDIVEGRGAGVSLTDAQVETELNKAVPFENYTQNNLESNGRGADPTTNLPANPEALEGEFMFEIESDLELISILNESPMTVPNQPGGQSRGIISTAILIKSVSKIAFQVIKRFVQKRDHDFYPTIIEELLRELYIAELGASVWNSMKEKSKAMWQDNSGVSGINQYAGRYLFDKLADYHQKYPDIQVNLVGHSAGSIAICNLVKMSAVAYPELIFENIIFLAPACRIDLFTEAIVSNSNRFKTFRMFTMTDENEKKDILVRHFYTHSLLYLISGILEDNGKSFDAYILGLERFIRDLPPYNIDELAKPRKFIFEAGKNRIAFSKTDETTPEGLRTASITHGDFEDDDTINSIKFMLKQ